MAKTLAQLIYYKMEIGKEYTTSQLSRLIGDEYYNYIPKEEQPNQPNGYPITRKIASEMWKVVKSGYATTRSGTETVADVRGLKFGTKPKSYTTYKVRYWTRLK